MLIPLNIAGILAAYLMGSFSSAIVLGKWVFGTDVREYGSGSAGATNALRVLGKKAGILVLILDMLKGWLAVNIPYLLDFLGFTGYLSGTVEFTNLQLVMGVAAILGHVFPLYFRFKGGKGIATLLGVILAVHPPAAIIALCIFLIIVLWTKFVSLGSMIAAMCFPIVVIVVYQVTTQSLITFSLIIPIIVLLTHQKNIERLLRREENKIKRRAKKSGG